jgi:hypothetical protein
MKISQCIYLINSHEAIQLMNKVLHQIVAGSTNTDAIINNGWSSLMLPKIIERFICITSANNFH